MKKRKRILLTISILAAIVAAVFIYIVIISVNNKDKSNNAALPTIPGDGKVLLMKDVPVDINGLKKEELCTILATMIQNDAGYAATYIPEKTEIITGENSSFYSKVCKKQQFDDENSYDAMLYKHQSTQAKRMTEFVGTYENGSNKTVFIWDYSEDMWKDLIADYDQISSGHQEGIEFMCGIGALSLDNSACVNPGKVLSDEEIEEIFNRLIHPGQLVRAGCFVVGEGSTIGFSDTLSYIAMAQMSEWIAKNAGIIGKFISFDPDGVNLCLCFSTENMGLFCWPLSFGKDAIFSYDTAKYNMQAVKNILSFCMDFSHDLVGENAEEDLTEKLLNTTRTNDFEGYFLELNGENNKTIEVSISQLDENGLRFQLKGGNKI